MALIGSGISGKIFKALSPQAGLKTAQGQPSGNAKWAAHGGPFLYRIQMQRFFLRYFFGVSTGV
jgi:hypothetical protein